LGTATLFETTRRTGDGKTFEFSVRRRLPEPNSHDLPCVHVDVREAGSIGHLALCQFRIGSADYSEPWMQLWVKAFCDKLSVRRHLLRTPKPREGPRHSTIGIVLPTSGELAQIDEKLVLGVKRLNELGFTTQFCCQGGTGHDIAYLVLKEDKTFPPELLQAWRCAGFEVTHSAVYATTKALFSQQLEAAEVAFPNSVGPHRRKAGPCFSPELLFAWRGARFAAPVSEANTPLLHGHEQALADNFCRSLDDWAREKLDLSGFNYRVGAHCKSSPPTMPTGSPEPMKKDGPLLDE